MRRTLRLPRYQPLCQTELTKFHVREVANIQHNKICNVELYPSKLGYGPIGPHLWWISHLKFHQRSENLKKSEKNFKNDRGYLFPGKTVHCTTLHMTPNVITPKNAGGSSFIFSFKGTLFLKKITKWPRPTETFLRKNGALHDAASGLKWKNALKCRWVIFSISYLRALFP